MALRRTIGPPGCGKTTYVASEVQQVVNQGKRVLLASLTRAAATEIAGRNLDIPAECVGTLHAHCYRTLGNPPIADTPKHLKEWNTKYPSFAMSGGVDVDEDNLGSEGSMLGDRLMMAYQIARARMLPVINDGVKLFVDKWTAWKEEQELLDFTDLIEMCLNEVSTAPTAPDVILVDEAQDMSELEMALVRKWAGQAEHLTVVGDPWQNLYQWRGTDPAAFSGGEAEEAILSQSYRVPARVHEFAINWISQMPGYEPIDYYPRDYEGVVEYTGGTWRYPEPILHDLEKHCAEGKTVMLLTSCNYMLTPLLKTLRDRGIPFHNPYRRKQGAWNPLQPRRDTVSTAQRVAAFLRMSQEGFWTGEDLRCWAEMLRVKGVLLNQRDSLSLAYDGSWSGT